MPRSSKDKRAARALQASSSLTYQQALQQVRDGNTPRTASSQPPRPAWGLGDHVPADALAAWGARTIITPHVDGLIDFLPDRQGTDGGEHSARLLDLLNERCPISRLRDIITTHRKAGRLSYDQPGTVVLYDDPQLTIDADTNGSHGYLYITAWLNPTEYPTYWYPPVEDGGADWLDTIHAINGTLAEEDRDRLGFTAPEFIQQYRGQNRLIERYPSYDIMFPIRDVDIHTGTTITPQNADAAQLLKQATQAATGK